MEDELDRGRAVVLADQDGRVVSVEDEGPLVRSLLADAEVVGDGAAVVGAADPLVGARNWKLAASGACLTASRVANRVAVSTPLRIGSWTSAAVSVLVMAASFWPVGAGQTVTSRCSPGTGRAARAVASRSMAALSCFWSAMNAGTGG